MSAFPEVPKTPIGLWTLNHAIFTELGPRQYFLFAQLFFMKTMPEIFEKLIRSIQTRREVLGVRPGDCNYDVLSLRELNRNRTVFLTAIQRSGSPEFAKALIDGFLDLVMQYYWSTIRTYVEDGLSSEEYFDRIFSLVKIHIHDHEAEQKSGKRGGKRSGKRSYNSKLKTRKRKNN